MQTPDFSAQRQNPQLVEAAIALNENRLHDAEPILRTHLKDDPFDVAAIRMFAELAARIGRYKDAETLLRRAVELAPNFLAARSNLATVLHKQNRSEEAVEELNTLAAIDPDNLGNANLKAAVLGRIGEYDEALSLYEQVLGRFAANPKIWMSYGHILKTVGRQADCVEAYRKALDILPGLGEVWWSLANLKTVRFSDDDITAMARALDSDQISEDDRFHLNFALGKAYEDRRDAETSFRHYETGNSQRRARLHFEGQDYSAQDTSNAVKAAKALYTAEFYEARKGQGCPAPDPIFILGMPRAGSTLIEQILASHSMVEGTMELPDIPMLAAQVERKGGITAQSADDLVALGQMFIDRTQVQRKTDKPFYIDKLPNNWLHTGFIRAILPNAKIIDARRHPLDCCWSNFKQHFAKGQNFSYSLSDMGRYYADYVDLMAHFDQVLPGQIHRVIHEHLLDKPEREVRALLDYLGLPFEDGCLKFYTNDRAVRTASSEQVRRPINRDGVDQWKMFDPWLDPLKTELGAILDTYPAVPQVFI
jgi:tetratricopeptide (TPR) repeat protein